VEVPGRAATRLSTAGGDAELAELALQLVRIDSANPATAPGGPGEAEIASFAAGWLRDRGLEVSCADVAPGRPSVVGVVRGSGAGPSLMLVGHLDTFARPADAGSGPILDGSILRGPGAFDMKGGVAVLMTAAADIARIRLRGDVLVVLVPDEEHRSLGIRSVLRDWRADAAVVGESTNLAVGVAHRGRVQLLVEVGDRADLVRLGLRLAFANREAECSRYVMAEEREHAAWVRRMLEPGDTPADALRDLRDTIGGDVRVRWTDVREPFLADPGHPFARCLVASLERRVGHGETTTLEGWTEAGVLGAAGLPAVVFGPAGGDAHTDGEWLDLAGAETCRHVLRDAALGYCGLAADEP